MQRTFQLTVSVVFACLTSMAFAKTAIQCNRAQTKCVTDNYNISIGDDVGVFNGDGELVATGAVSSMDGERRAVIIKKRHGTIYGNYSLALLETRPSSSSFDEAYTIYKAPARRAIGAELGLSTWALGAQTPAPEYSVFAQWRQRSGLQLIGRGVFTAMSGRVTRFDENGRDEQPVSIKGGGLLGGIGYIARDGKTLSLRGEIAVGGMFVSAAVAGDPALVSDQDFNIRLKNGLNLYGRGSVGAMLNYGSWHLHADLSASRIAQLGGTSLAAGVSKDLP